MATKDERIQLSCMAKAVPYHIRIHNSDTLFTLNLFKNTYNWIYPARSSLI